MSTEIAEQTNLMNVLIVQALSQTDNAECNIRQIDNTLHIYQNALVRVDLRRFYGHGKA